jgi:hypothetical protein
MAENFFDTLSAEEKQRIKDRTDTLVELLEQWARQYSFIRTVRIPVAALTTATALLRTPLSDSVLSSQVMLWIAGVDDKIDGLIFSLAEVWRKTEQWCSIANHGSSNGIDDSDALTAVLLEIREKLSKSHIFEPLREYWASCLRLLVEAMAQEYQYGLQYNAYGSRALPSLDEYLHSGIHSIGMYFWQSTVLILLRDSSVIEHFEPINKAIKHASVAIRLYNDVQTFDKEIQEGGINSILIMYHIMLDKNPSATKRILSEAKQHILQLADSYAQRCYDSIKQIQTESGQFEETTYRIVAFGSFFYREHDYHTTPIAKVNEFLGKPKSTD